MILRPDYVTEIKKFIDVPLVKVLSGVRRCGKSTILSMIKEELETNRNMIKELITKEEELFQKTLLQGEKRLEEIFETSKKKKICGEDAFKLYDTYGKEINSRHHSG